MHAFVYASGLPASLPAAVLLVWLAMASMLLRRRAVPARWFLSPLAALAGSLAVLLLLGLVARSGSGSTLWQPWLGAPLTRALALVATGLILGATGARSLSSRPHSRGARLADLPGRRHADKGKVTIAGHALSPADETKHTKLIGTTGTGKSTLISELLGAALARGDRAIIADPDGGYLERFYRPERGDRILNPFDERSATWAPFAEIDAPFHVDELARALVPDGVGAAREWSAYARTFVGAVLGQLAANGNATLGELYRVLLVADQREISILLEGTPAQPFTESGNERMFSSLRAVAANAVRGLGYLCQHDGEPLAVRQWVREGEGVLFLPYRADQVAALRSLVSAWLRLAIFQTLSLKPTRSPAERPLWFVIDELDALGTIDGLGDALARLRKFGGRCVLGFQSIAQVSSTYGTGVAHTLVENCGNTVILRCSASEGGGTARFASQLVGEREVASWQVTRSVSGGGWRARQASTSRSLQWRTEHLLLPAEIEQLPDRSGYLKIASEPAWIPVRF